MTRLRESSLVTASTSRPAASASSSGAMLASRAIPILHTQGSVLDTFVVAERSELARRTLTARGCSRTEPSAEVEAWSCASCESRGRGAGRGRRSRAMLVRDCDGTERSGSRGARSVVHG